MAQAGHAAVRSPAALDRFGAVDGPVDTGGGPFAAPDDGAAPVAGAAT
jgi:hypothetical protein